MSLKELKKFTQYRIVVSPYNANGNGVPSEPVNDTTFEDGKRKLVHYYKSCILIAEFLVALNCWTTLSSTE